MTPLRSSVVFAVLLPWGLAGCGPSESELGYQVRGSAVFWVDRVTPDALKGGYGGIVYERREYPLVGADARTFQVLAHPAYAKDATHVFVDGRLLEGADAPTFQLIGGDRMAKDARHVWAGNYAIPGADPATFAFVGNGLVARDRKDYYWGSKPLHVRDVGAFKVLRPDASSSDVVEMWGYDTQGFWVRDEMTPIADGATFQYLGFTYAKDGKQVYFQRGVFFGADPKTFRFVGGECAADAAHAFWHDFVLEGADPRSLTVMDYHYVRDAARVYHMNERIDGADAPSFQVIGPSTKGFGYARDAKRVYYAASVIEGADPATFAVDPGDPERATDKAGPFQYGKRVGR